MKQGITRLCALKDCPNQPPPPVTVGAKRIVRGVCDPCIKKVQEKWERGLIR